jgi:hypothetical protein
MITLKWLWVGTLGMALLLPAVLYWGRVWISDPVRTPDAHTAFQRLASVPISQAERDAGTEITAVIPNDVSWRRIIRDWGDPGYFIGAVAPDRTDYIYCLQGLGAKVEATIGDRPLALEPAFVPYLYSVDCPPAHAGLMFRAPPGAVVKIHVTVIGQHHQLADLVVQPYWRGEAKDRLVGVYMRDDLQPIVNKLGLGGLITIAVAVLLFLRRPHQPFAAKGCQRG